MENFLANFNLFIGLGTVALQIFLVLAILTFFFSKHPFKTIFFTFIGKNSLLIGFLISLAAMVTSLIYSDFIGFDPCKLCWLQRIFIYPQVLLFALAWWKDDRRIDDYSLVLSIIGLCIALYHKSVEITGFSAIPCGVATVSCSKIYVEMFGYITIPVMSLTLFVTLVALMALHKYYDRHHQKII